MQLDRYMIRLWLAPFLLALSIATGLLLLGRALKLLELLSGTGVDLSVMFLMLAAVIPYFLVLTVPIAAFFAMQSLVIRLQRDSEMDALRAAGVSYVRMFRGLAVISLILWSGLAYTAMEWMPQGQKAFQGFIYALQFVKGTPEFDPQRFNRDLDDFTLYTSGVDAQGTMHDFILEDARQGGRVVYVAETARITQNGEFLRFNLHSGTRLEGQDDSLRAIYFEDYQVSVNVGQFGLSKTPVGLTNIFSMGMLDLHRHIQQEHDSAAVAEWHRRLLLPTSVLVLMLFAVPISMEPKRSGSAGAYIVGVLVLLLVYNMQIALHQQVVKEQFAWWSMWLGQLLMAGLGLYLFHRVSRDRLTSVTYWLAGVSDYLREKLHRYVTRRSDLREQ